MMYMCMYLTVLTLPPMLLYEGSCDFGLILVRTWDLGKVTFSVVGKCKVRYVPKVCICVYGYVYGYGIYGRYIQQ